MCHTHGHHYLHTTICTERRKPESEPGQQFQLLTWTGDIWPGNQTQTSKWTHWKTKKYTSWILNRHRLASNRLTRDLTWPKFADPVTRFQLWQKLRAIHCTHAQSQTRISCYVNISHSRYQVIHTHKKYIGHQTIVCLSSTLWRWTIIHQSLLSPTYVYLHLQHVSAVAHIFIPFTCKVHSFLLYIPTL